MKTDRYINSSRHCDVTAPDPAEPDSPEVLTWFDEADRALGDCLERIERLAPDTSTHHALRGELLFLLRAARADLLTRYLETTFPPKNGVDELSCR